MQGLLSPTTLALPTVGDVRQGAGTSMQGRAQASAADASTVGSTPQSTIVAPDLHQTVLGQPVVAALVLLVILFLIKWFSERGGTEGEFGSLRIGFYNGAAITLIAVLGLNILKWFATRWVIPGFSSLVLAA